MPIRILLASRCQDSRHAFRPAQFDSQTSGTSRTSETRRRTISTPSKSVRLVALLEDKRRRLQLYTVHHRSAIVNRWEERLYVLRESEFRLRQRIEMLD